ncbi:DUF892 family protein [Deinococcus altitudinis]|uniref:DUF892 family protein n=1 Tax=Deinococcus altitudinis TaxID=468914 RepID=UPI0038915889
MIEETHQSFYSDLHEMFDLLEAEMTLAELNLRLDQVRSLYLIHLHQMYSAEELMFTATPVMAISVCSTEIKAALLTEASKAPDRLAVLTNIFAELEESTAGPICLPVKALVDLSTEVNVKHAFGPERDLLLLTLALEMKQLNVSKYLMAATYARALNLPEQVLALSAIEQTEMEIDNRLKLILHDTIQVIPAHF